MDTNWSYTDSRPRIASRGRTVAFYVATILHWLLGILWVLLVLVAVSLRDCLLECDPVTAAEAHAEIAVWCLGGLSWAVLFAFVLDSRNKERVFLGLELVPVWFVVATACGVLAILDSAG